MENPQVFNRLTGDLIAELSINFDKIIANENIPLFSYHYDGFVVGAVPNSLVFGEYEYLEGKGRKNILHASPKYEFRKDSAGVKLELTFKRKISFSYLDNYIKTSLPFDWEKMEINLDGTILESEMIESIKHYIDKKEWQNHKISGYFLGFRNEKMFGYLQKKPKAFVVEKVGY